MKPQIKRLIQKGQQFAQERQTPVGPTAEEIRITNETVAARREEVLGSARKFIYPLQASKRRVVKLTVAILIAAVVGFFAFCLLELYKFQSTSTFIYGVSEVIPFPVAIIDHHYLVSYNDYLFELRHYMHYYQSQHHQDFSTKDGLAQLATYKQQSMEQALQHAYVARLADRYHLSVSQRDIDDAINLVRSQNRLGASDQVFQSVLSDFWGWSVDDFRRELGNELLAQKVVDRLDTGTHSRADQVLAQLKQGADFAALAQQDSDDDLTRSAGGDYGMLIDRSTTEIPPQVITTLFQLQPGQYSGIINTGYSLEIVKVTSAQGNQIRASHIAFKFQPITTYTAPLEASMGPFQLIRL